MKRSPIIFLRSAVVLTGIVALALLLWEPRLEGRNAHATLFAIYFRDPFLAYAYIASLPFFAALHQIYKALSYAGRNEAFSPAFLEALRDIRYCALAVIGFALVGEIFIMLNESDDRAGGVFIGLLIAFASTVVAAAASVLEQILRNAVEMKSGRDPERT